MNKNIQLGSHWEYQGAAGGKGFSHRIVAVAQFLDEIVTVGVGGDGMPSFSWLGDSQNFLREFKFLKPA